MTSDTTQNRFASRLAPDIAERVLQQEAANAGSTKPWNAAEARAAFLAAKRPLERKANTLSIRDFSIPSRGGKLDVRRYTPTVGVSAPFSAFVYFHGGAFTTGDLDSHDDICCTIAQEGGCVVLNVDYRVLPDHPFPAAYEDALDAIQWLYDHAAEYQVDPTRIAAGGDSAGANLATAAALQLRGTVPVKALWMAYPIIGTDFDTPSYLENAQAPLLTRERCIQIMQQYFGRDLAEADWRVAPLLADNIAGLPPTVLIGAELDPLYSDADLFAARLREIGQEAVEIPAKGMPHGFMKWVYSSESVRRIAVESIQALRRLLDK